MLRRSTGWSDEIKRVGIVRGTETRCGEENCRYVALARLRSTESAEDACSDVVGMAGLSEAMDCRNSRRGSCCTGSGDAILSLMLKPRQNRSCGVVRLLKRKTTLEAVRLRVGNLTTSLYGSLPSVRVQKFR